MTMNNHPITPPDELVQQWIAEGNRQEYCTTDEYLIDKVARWGYEQRGAVNEAELQKARDEELEACLEEIRDGAGRVYIDESKLRVCLADDIWTARRPKPESQADGALILLDDVSDLLDAPHENGIRRALERLRELEDSNPKLPTPVATEPPISFVFEGKRYTRADLVSSGDKDWGKHLVIGGVEYFPSSAD